MISRKINNWSATDSLSNKKQKSVSTIASTWLFWMTSSFFKAFIWKIMNNQFSHLSMYLPIWCVYKSSFGESTSVCKCSLTYPELCLTLRQGREREHLSLKVFLLIFYFSIPHTDTLYGSRVNLDGKKVVSC